ncbi:MAG: tetratricopeptide repeat protein [Planctomycetaceae bacterium]|nr:tetratricopeptide repeat protein [Planctomycetaceae bacterium]
MGEHPPGAAALSSCNGTPPNARRIPKWMSGTGLVALALVLLGGWWWFSPEPVERIVRRGRFLLAQRRFDQVLQHVEQVLRRDPHSVPALLLAAEAEIGAGRNAKALQHLEAIPDDGSPQAIAARLLAADLFLNTLQELDPSEEHVRRALTMAPDSAPAQERMVYILGLQSRSWEAIPFRLRSLTHERPTSLTLFFLSLAENALENPEHVENLAKSAPDDPGVQLAVARVQFELKNYTNAEKLASAVARRHPERAEAFVQWGRGLLELGHDDQFRTWSQTIPSTAEEHPGVWYLRGAWGLRAGQTRVAVRCFWEALRRDPNHQKACYQLGQCLVTLQKKSEAEPFLNRSRQLEAYARLAEAGHNLQQSRTCLQAACQAEQLGLLWEACGWAQVALDLDATQTAAVQLAERLNPQLQNLPLVRAAPGSNPADAVDLSAFPLSSNPHIPQRAAAPTAKHDDAANSSRNLITFEDSAARAGLNFEYYNGGEPRTKGLAKMYEVVGGGAAVLDYDQDGHPDLYLPQGATWPLNETQRTHLDQLFHNLGDGRFQNVTGAAKVLEPGFSQGAGIGDVNDDGFPDVYVANIGGNRLFVNHGDGTFQDATAITGTAGERYTASVLVADVNGDAWPDIYTVNYLAGDDLFTRACGDSTGYVGSCLPQLFSAAADQLFLNLGDGRFEEISREAGIGEVSGKGLGIVAFAVEGGGPLRLFVANDVGPNFLFVNQASAGERPRFVDQGFPAGVAVNGAGRSESSMGVAAGDYDGNGSLDLFVTNFDEETNTLYDQQSAGVFVDRTAAADLNKKREPYVGWGTQFLDADLDGWPDLILTNGHVNDVRRSGKPFQMPAEFFRNRGNGTFENVPAADLGPFFQVRRLGRGLARLDWNSDCREDAVISHLDAPVALLTNTTPSPGHYFTLELRGVRSNRDAIGAIVQILAAGRTCVRQLTAGDGNQASNERKLIFGLGTAKRVEQLEIQWPSGIKQSFTNLPANTAWLGIEGHSKLISTARSVSPPAESPADAPRNP